MDEGARQDAAQPVWADSFDPIGAGQLLAASLSEDLVPNQGAAADLPANGRGSRDAELAPVAVSEPASAALLIAGLLMRAFVSRRRSYTAKVTDAS